MRCTAIIGTCFAPEHGLLQIRTANRKTKSRYKFMKLDTHLTVGVPSCKTVTVMPGMEIKYLAIGGDTGGAYSVFEIDCEPGAGPPAHIHSLEDESFYVLEGTFEFHIGDQTLIATPGWFGIGPRGLAHAFRATSDKPAKMLMIANPSGFENFFDELGDLHANPDTAPSQVEKVFAAYGMQLV